MSAESAVARAAALLLAAAALLLLCVQQAEAFSLCGHLGGSCLNGGSCVSHSGVYSCRCPPSHTGVFCEQSNSCDPPCQKNRTCAAQSNASGTTFFQCRCPVGWIGDDCRTPADVCSTIAANGRLCANGGSCVETDSGRKICECPVGFRGPTCEETGDMCSALSPCQRSGTCINTPDGYRCQCSPVFAGSHCERLFEPCNPSPCENGGSCNVTGTFNYSCVCRVGFSGKHCEERIGNCTGHRCANGARCIPTTSALGYQCQCRPGYSGTHCTDDIDECSSSPCRNGGTCRNTSPGYHCQCSAGWVGDNCQLNADECASQPCMNGGTCHDGVGAYRCECSRGWTGAACHLPEECPRGLTGRLCDAEIDECASSPCQNNGTCIDQLGRFYCICPQGLRGSLCQQDVNECLQSPCRNGGTCRNRKGSFSCDCPSGYEGELCHINTNDCADSPCLNGGTCIDQINGYICMCSIGYDGRNCSVSENIAALRCAPQPCHPVGTASCGSLYGENRPCVCRLGWSGTWCEAQDANATVTRLLLHSGPLRDTPAASNVVGASDIAGVGARACSSSSPCLNGGSCVSTEEYAAAHCRCTEQFTGARCEALLSRSTPPCGEHACSNGATCATVSGGGYRCLCPPGRSGNLCELNAGSRHAACRTSPCGANALGCRESPDGSDVICTCKPNWSGARCQTWSEPRDGGPPPGGSQASSATFNASCAPECAAKVNNQLCDAECNTATCQSDAVDCQQQRSAAAVPWAHCTAVTARGLACPRAFNDGVCDEPCNVEPCLYDGFDCRPPQPICDPTIVSYCKRHYADGHCDRGCYNAECGWDGLDCLPPPPLGGGGSGASSQLARGELHVFVLAGPDEFLNRSGDFLLTLGRLLRTVVKLKLDERARPLVVPWTTVDANHRLVAGSLVTLTLDNSKCVNGEADSQQQQPQQRQHECFETAASAAEFVAAALNKGWSPGLSIGAVNASSAISPDKTQPPGDAVPNYVYLVAGAAVLVIVAVLVGVYVGGRRKRAHGITWFPEGFVLSSTEVAAKRKCPEGEAEDDVEDATLRPTADAGPDVEGNGGDNDDDDGYSHAEPLTKKRCSSVKADLRDAAAIELLDRRTWSARHYDAGLKSSALTPPRHDEQLLDANCRGPGGLTPLMLAAAAAASNALPTEPHSRGRCSTASASESGSQTSAEDLEALTELIEQGASVRDCDDRGETALHHAARLGRAEEARFLLDKGADPNVKDLAGRTALHAAVAADAYRVFQMLLRDRRTNLNERTHDGATPMILAARLGVDDMVAELIQCKADVNAADEHGKTALHWAAAVNSVPAASMFLKFGVNCDVQDDQEQTPLHLAAKEGSYDVAALLLSYGASLDIADCQERLPEDLALERRHRRLVALLQQHGAGSRQQQQQQTLDLVPPGGSACFGSIGAGHRRLSKKRCHQRAMRFGLAMGASGGVGSSSNGGSGWWRYPGTLPGSGSMPSGLLFSSDAAAAAAAAAGLPLFIGCGEPPHAARSAAAAAAAARLAGLPQQLLGGTGMSGGACSIFDCAGNGAPPLGRSYDMINASTAGCGGGGISSPTTCSPALPGYVVGYSSGHDARGGRWPMTSPTHIGTSPLYVSHSLPSKQQQQQQQHLQSQQRCDLDDGNISAMSGWRSTAAAAAADPFVGSTTSTYPYNRTLAETPSESCSVARSSSEAHGARLAAACGWSFRAAPDVVAPTAVAAASFAAASCDGSAAAADLDTAGATPSPDSGTGWSSDCSGFSPPACGGAAGSVAVSQACARGYRMSCDVASSRPDRLSSLSNGSPQSDWSDCISPAEHGPRNDAVFA